jgi:hypothetical protein
MLDSCVQCRYGNELVKRTLIGNDFHLRQATSRGVMGETYLKVRG